MSNRDRDSWVGGLPDGRVAQPFYEKKSRKDTEELQRRLSVFR